MLVFSYNQTESLHLLPVFSAGGHDVDAGGVDAAVAQNIRQFGDILFQLIESAGKELAQIMGKDLAWAHVGFATERFHLGPYTGAVHRRAF